MSEIYLVTGAAGHLGNNLVHQLLKKKKRVRILVLEGEKNIPKGDIQVCYGDVRNKLELEPFFSHEQNQELIVIHCAGIVSIASKYLQSVYDVNVSGTKNIVDLCIKNKVKKLVHVSSVHAIPEGKSGSIITEITTFDPSKVTGLYAKTKSEATAYVLEASKRGLNVSIVHPSGIIGPYDFGRGHLTMLLIDYCNKRLTAAIRGGYDFVDVRDVCHGILACAEKGKKGECYILSGHFYEIKQLLDILHDITGVRKIKTILPFWFAKLTAPLAETYYKILKQPPLYTAYSIYTLNTNAIFSNQKAVQELGYRTRSMEETLKDTVDWLKANKRI